MKKDISHGICLFTVACFEGVSGGQPVAYVSLNLVFKATNVQAMHDKS